MTVLLSFSPHNLLTVLRTLSHLSLCSFLPFCCGHWSWRDQPISSYLLTTVPNKQALLARLAVLLAISTARDEAILLNDLMSPSSLPRPSLASRGFHFRPEASMNDTCLNDIVLSGTIVPSRPVQMLTQTPGFLQALL